MENTYTQVRPERSFTLLEDVDCPAVLAEQCFVTNDEDVEHFGAVNRGCKYCGTHLLRSHLYILRHRTATGEMNIAPPKENETILQA